MLPAFNEVLSFPTTISVNRQGEATKIHTGYSGPATGQYYEEFAKAFNADGNQLLNETPQKTPIGRSRK